MKEESQSPQRELYALLHLSLDASDEEIRKSYRQWAQIYHPDKYLDPEMKDIASENFQRIRDAYEILTDERKRQIYDIYGFEGLNSGLELGEKLNKQEEVKEELERLRRRQEEEKVYSHVRPVGSLLATLSLPQFLGGDGIMRGMQMSSEVQSQVSKKNTVVIGGNLAVTGKAGGGAATVLLRHQLSSVSSIEILASAGVRAVLGVQTSRHVSPHSTATTGLTISLRDGSINLANAWTRQLSETANGNIQLVLGTENSITVGWQKKDEKNSAAGELKFGVGSFGATAHYTRHFSSKSHGRVASRIGSTALEFEVGGGRKISDFSTVRWFYTIGIQGISWRVELHRGGQKLIVPVLLSGQLNPFLATGALIIPTSLYFLLKTFVVKPYYLKRERLKAQERRQRTSAQVEEARKAAEKAQILLKNVSNRKKTKQLEAGGLVITRSVYGNLKAYKKNNGLVAVEINELVPQVLDVTIPLNFLISDSGYLKLHKGIKKSGIMGFCDPCPEELKQLFVEYTFRGQKHEVTVSDYDELAIPHELHKV